MSGHYQLNHFSQKHCISWIIYHITIFTRDHYPILCQGIYRALALLVLGFGGLSLIGSPVFRPWDIRRFWQSTAPWRGLLQIVHKCVNGQLIRRHPPTRWKNQHTFGVGVCPSLADPCFFVRLLFPFVEAASLSWVVAVAAYLNRSSSRS